MTTVARWPGSGLPVAGGRGDLLAEVAGLLTGFHGDDPDESRARAAASFCIAAGAGESLTSR